jgi:hypothetical protein
MIRCLAPVILVSLCLACGPTGLLPGGELDGPSTPTPDDWKWTDEVSTIQLETRPEDPYSVNIWIIALDDKLYVHAGANRATWVENIEADPSVRVQIDEKIYDLMATRVEEQAEFDAFADAYEVKYSSRPRNEDVTEAYLYSLRSR